MVKAIDHIFPAIGKQSIRIFGQTELLYNWMVGNKIIERLASTPQLGMANIHFSEFRHTRLDYTYLILLIIDILKERSSEFRFSLSTSKPYIIGKTTYKWSGAEVLQAWVLLLNMGHMHDTFFSESVLRRHFKKHWQAIAPHFTRQWARSLAKEILSDSDYRFHHLLSLLELEQFPKNSKLYKPFAGLIGIYRGSNLASVGVKTPPRIEYLRQAYRAIRKIAFLALDTHYSRCPFGITLPKLLAILPTFISKILDDNKLITSQIHSLNHWMNDHYYCSTSCIITMLNNIHPLDKSYAKSLKPVINNKDKFLELIKNWKRGSKAIHPAVDWLHVIRLPVVPPSNIDEKNRLFPVYFQEPQTNPDYRLSVINVAGGDYFLDIFARHTPDPYRVLSLIPQPGLLGIFNRLSEDDSYRYSGSKDDSAQYRERWRMVRHNCSEHLFAYVDVIFKLLSKKDEVVQFQPVKSKGIGWLFCRNVDEVKKDMDAYIDSDFKDYATIISTKEVRIRQVELEFMKNVVLKHIKRWDYIALYTGSIDVYNPQKGESCTDIDGLAILVKGQDIRLLLLQSKTSYKGPVTQAKKWFNKKLKPLLPAIKGVGKHKIHTYKDGIAISIDFKHPTTGGNNTNG